MNRLHRFSTLLLQFCMILAANGVLAQAYPNHAIRLIVGGAPGSVPDTLARPVAERLSSALEQPVVVENRPGAAGIIAMEALSRSAADGYTLALATMSQAVFNSYLFSKLPYDPQRDLEPVATLATGAMVLAAHPSFPGRSLQEYVTLARSQPGTLFVAMPQAGSPPHVIALLLNGAAGIAVTMVPHKSGTDAVASVLSGEIPLIIDAPTIISPHVQTGRLRALAVTGQQREDALPGIPTVRESGFPAVEGEAWIGLVAPIGTPTAISLRLNREIASILTTPEMQALMAKFSFRTLVKSPAEFRSLINNDHAKWSAVIREAKLKLD